MHTAIEFSEKISDFDETVQDFVEKYVVFWQEADIEPALPAETYTPADQRENERKADRLNDSLVKALRDYPGKKHQQSSWHDRMFRLLRQYGTRILGYPDSNFDILFSPEYFAATRAFIREARVFDDGMKTEAIAQALRNVWIVNCLQLLFGGPPVLSRPVLAYSLLYPYTDNYLDHPDHTVHSKKRACNRFERRLSGQRIDPENEHESSVFSLVGMIEDEFPRSIFPGVYSSLLAIHAAQVESLSQQSKMRVLDEQQLLRISFTKGGTSVLADGWLINGTLKDSEADFCFGYGVALQLLDDLQDINEDRSAGHRTIFTLGETADMMDHATRRLWNFIHGVMNSSDCFDSARGLELRTLISSSGRTMILNSMAEYADLYTGEFLRCMERYSPLHFTYMRNNSRETRSRIEKTWKTLVRKRKLRSVFDLIVQQCPNSL